MITFNELMQFQGWAIIPEKIESQLVTRLRNELHLAVQYCESLRSQNNLGHAALGTAHHLLGQGESFTELFANFPGTAYAETLLGEYLVLNSYAGTLNPPFSSAYAHKVHRDIRFYIQTPIMMLNTLILLDDFTQENGGTYLLSGSHLLRDKPSDSYFKEFSTQIIATAGSILIFNSNIWHASGINNSANARAAVSMTFSSPEIKPQYNFTQYANKFQAYAEKKIIPQLLGVKIKTPNSLEEAYQR